jgi:hypothetical protein
MSGTPWAAVLVLLGGCAAASVHGPRRAEAPAAALHPVLLAYVATLDEWTTESERAALEAVDLEGTLGGDSERLRYLAADRVVRRLLPLALEAQGRPELREHAARLRGLPPLLNRDTDAVAVPYVRAAVRALRGDAMASSRAIEAMIAAQAADASLEGPAADGNESSIDAASRAALDPDLESDLADALAEYADAYAQSRGVSRLHADAAAAAAADTLDAGLLFRTAVDQWGVSREQALALASELLSDMAGAARRGERIPYVPRAEEPPTDAARPFGP